MSAKQLDPRVARLGWMAAGALAVALPWYFWTVGRPGPVGAAVEVSASQAADASIHPVALKQASPKGTLRLATYNIHHGEGHDRRIDLARTAKVLDGMDLVGLQEVWGARLGQSQTQLDILKNHLDIPGFFGPTERQWWREAAGNGLLSRHPIQWMVRLPLPQFESKSPRNMMVARVLVDEQPVHVIVTHLDRSSALDRQQQFHTVTSLFRSLAPPAVLMGDLNMDGSDPLMVELLQMSDVVSVLAGTPWEHDGHIDWILVRQMGVLEVGVNDSDASDHPCIWAELTLSPAGHEVAHEQQHAAPWR